MNLFADTANIDEINYCFDRGVSDGITTNPKIIESTGELSLGFEGACKSILKKFPRVPVSLETDLKGINVMNLEQLNSNKIRDILLNQAYEIAGWGKNAVIKIPLSKGGLKATKILSKKGIKTNVTACMTPYGALKAAESNATYVSLFANRMLDSNILEMSGNSLEKIINGFNWKEIVKKNKERYFERAWEKVLNDVSYVATELSNSDSELIVGSIRSPLDVLMLANAGPQVITVPPKIVKGLKEVYSIKNSSKTLFGKYVDKTEGLNHPMTLYTLEEFEKAATIYRK